MDPEDKIIAESIRNGSYFEASRGWFQTIYVGPISERAFFLVVAALAGFVAFNSIIALTTLMPLTDKPPIFLYANQRPDDTITKLVELRKPSDAVDSSMMEFYLTKYIESREGFSAVTYAAHASFVRAQSDDATYAAYAAANDPTNPNSFGVLLGASGQRIVDIDSIRIDNDGAEGAARVRFTADLAGVETPAKTKWTAQLKFRYTNIVVTMVKNEETGKQEMHATDPQFQVVSYELEQN